MQYWDALLREKIDILNNLLQFLARTALAVAPLFLLIVVSSFFFFFFFLLKSISATALNKLFEWTEPFKLFSPF